MWFVVDMLDVVVCCCVLFVAFPRYVRCLFVAVCRIVVRSCWLLSVLMVMLCVVAYCCSSLLFVVQCLSVGFVCCLVLAVVVV